MILCYFGREHGRDQSEGWVHDTLRSPFQCGGFIVLEVTDVCEELHHRTGSKR